MTTIFLEFCSIKNWFYKEHFTSRLNTKTIISNDLAYYQSVLCKPQNFAKNEISRKEQFTPVLDTYLNINAMLNQSISSEILIYFMVNWICIIEIVIYNWFILFFCVLKIGQFSIIFQTEVLDGYMKLI